jgi:hypothetical protein
MYNKVVLALAPFAGDNGVVEEKCPFGDCIESSRMNLSVLINHLSYVHFKGELLKEIKIFQVRQFILRKNLCLASSACSEPISINVVDDG